MLGIRYKDSKTPIGLSVVGTSEHMVEYKEKMKEIAKQQILENKKERRR